MNKKKDSILVYSLFILFFLCTCTAGVEQKDNPMSEPKNSYLQNGRLLPCPGSPNCVSSETFEGVDAVAPLQIKGSPAKAWQNLQEVIVQSGGQLEEVTNTFLHATYRSAIFRFVDDLTCRLDTTDKVIHIRSASRLGYSDLGVNARRVEKIRQLYGEATQAM